MRAIVARPRCSAWRSTRRDGVPNIAATRDANRRCVVFLRQLRSRGTPYVSASAPAYWLTDRDLAARRHHSTSGFLGSDVLLRAGELNLMTAGDGVAHSEFSWLGDADSDAEVKSMRGLQLWVALPENARHGPALFEQHRELPQFSCDSLRVTVLLGELAGHRSPATVFTPIIGAEITASAGKSLLPIEPDFEHAILLLDGELQIDGETLVPGPLAYIGNGRSELAVQVNEFARFVLIGGEPFTEDLLMWWNFVARSQEEIETARADWQAQSARFPAVAGHGPDAGSEAGWIPAPPLPTVKLTPRRRSSSAKPS